MIDNDSNEETRLIVEGFAKGHAMMVSYVDAGGNIGPAGAYQLGMRILLGRPQRSPWIALMDDDDPPPNDTVYERLLSVAGTLMTDNFGGLALGGGILNRQLGIVSRWRDQADSVVSVDHLHGGFFPLYRSKALEEVGPMDGSLFFGFEELELGRRLTLHGFKLYVDVEHRKSLIKDIGKSAESLGRRRWDKFRSVPEPNWRRYYATRNLIRVLRSERALLGLLVTLISRVILKPLIVSALQPATGFKLLRLGLAAFMAGCKGENGRVNRTVAGIDLSREASLRPLTLYHLVATNRSRGAERVAHWLVEATNEYAPSIAQHIAALRDVPDGSEALVDGSLRSRPGPPILGLRRDLRKRRPDIVVAHGGEAARLAVLCCLGLGIPVVWHRILGLPDSAKSGPRRALWKIVAHRSAHIIAISGATEVESQCLTRRTPVSLIPNHRPARHFSEWDRSRSRQLIAGDSTSRRDVALVGFVGHLVEQKDPVLFLQVVARLDIVFERAAFVIIGDGPMRDEVLDARRTLGLEDEVRYLGHRDDVAQLLPGLDLLVLCSKEEATPGIAVEAQFAGVPIVSVPLDGIDLILEDGVNGRVVARSADALASAIRELVESPPRLAAMSHSAHAGRHGFSTELAVPVYLDIFRTLAPV